MTQNRTKYIYMFFKILPSQRCMNIEIVYTACVEIWSTKFP